MRTGGETAEGGTVMAGRIWREASLAILAGIGLAGCQGAAPGGGVADPVAPSGEAAPRWLGITTRLLEGDLVNFIVAVEGTRDPLDVIAYARCTAAQYTLIRGYGFARHIRTSVREEGGRWQADAVYLISPDLPKGANTLDAAAELESCRARGIPAV